MPERRRACGKRAAGGVYAETGLSEDGMLIEAFLVDPPQPIDMTALGLAAVGVKLIEIDGVWHVLDVVGQAYYPYPADYVEETRRMGASRRLPANLDYTRLSAESKLVLIHQKAIIVNYSDYPFPECPRGLVQHQEAPLPGSMCAGLWWHDLPGDADEQGRLLRVIKGGTHYWGHARPQGVRPEYRHGTFLILPITNLAVIKGGEATQANYEAASRSGLPVSLEDE